MATIGDWIRVRSMERLQILMDQARAVGICAPGKAESLDQKQIPGFTLARVAELQARCDALEELVAILRSDEVRH